MRFSTLVTRSVLGRELPLAYQVTSTGGHIYKSVTVAQLVIPNLIAGEFVQVYGASQVWLGEEDPPRAMHAGYLKATKAVPANNLHTEGLLLRRPMGVDFTELQQYNMHWAAGSFVAGGTWAGSVTLMLVNYAAALSGVSTNPESLNVRYVELRADRFTP